jgi:hypothetical protein
MLELYRYVPKEALDKAIADGFVSARKHPDAKIPLTILNYTHKTTIEGMWNDVTTKCRGLIYNHRNNIVVSRPPVKFWNINDPKYPETSETYLSKNYRARPPYVVEKLDGSMGILWSHSIDGWTKTYGIATRGSFESEQAQWATAWLRLRMLEIGASFTPDHTYVGEIIYPENRIVVNYAFQGWIPFAIIENNTGFEQDAKSVARFARQNYFRPARHFYMNWKETLKQNKDNEEGYVLTFHFPAPVGANWRIVQRVKVKFENYCRLHRILTGFNPKDVWELLSTEKPFAPLLTDDIPEHFKNWLLKWKMQLEADYLHLETEAKVAYCKVLSCAHSERKEAAEYVLTEFPNVSSIVFAMMDGKDYKDMIWKRIKPLGTDVFREEE